MRTYEYQKLDLNSTSNRTDDLVLLNAAGAQGWKLIYINASNIAYVMKELEPAPVAKRPYTRRTTAAEAPVEAK